MPIQMVAIRAATSAACASSACVARAWRAVPGFVMGPLLAGCVRHSGRNEAIRRMQFKTDVS